MSAACKDFKGKSCLYVIANSSGKPLYIGEAGGRDGLDGRYRGGTAHAIDAALNGSGNLIFVAAVSQEHREAIEKALIYTEQPFYNRQGKIIPLSSASVGSIVHEGEAPSFVHASLRRRAES